MSALLTGLLEKDVNKRLGCRGRGLVVMCMPWTPGYIFKVTVFSYRADELKELAFFADLDWDDVVEKKVSTGAF